MTYSPRRVEDSFFSDLLAANPKFRPTPAKPRYRAAVLLCGDDDDDAARRREQQRASALRAVRAASAEAYVAVERLASFVVAEDRHQGRSERLLAALSTASARATSSLTSGG